jgi:23S rRNA (cytidine1920-2'-O)/16S rRNA (cytidine1409-2'-O)-methyltransferase
LDKLLVGRGLVESSERALALIMAGRVLVNEQPASKAGAFIDDSAPIRILGENAKYVSRGGIKLEKALEHWKIDVREKICMDVGTSTGGFTDCLLQHGARQVIAVDTGYGQIDFRLRQDGRVRLLEKTNARNLTQDVLEEAVDFVAVDVSFISATVVLPSIIEAAFGSMKPQAPEDFGDLEIVVLVKPQFEARREEVGLGGIVRDEKIQTAAVDRVRDSLLALKCRDINVIDSPILGAEGNREFLMHAVVERTR